MRMRKILIVHETRILRTLLKTYLISELNDVVVIEALTAAEALENFKEQKFEAILCGMQFKKTDGVHIFKELRKEETNKDTPFIIITSTGSKENIAHLKENGIQHYLISPFTAIELREKINTVCDPRQWRTHDRISIPGAKAVISMNNDTIEADVINMSLEGILCDITCTKSYNDLLNSTHITVIFPPQFENTKIKILWCKLLRVNVFSWNEVYFPKCTPEHMRVVWQIVKMSDEDNQKFQEICKKVEKENKNIEAVKKQ
ncbi:MAG: response regulator [Planctomycetes bacterium]|nr:response regulator [Planctomycetota bacterium]